MRFVAHENWYDHNGAFHEANPDSPHVFDYPKDMVPNWKWTPLDAEAKAALDALAQATGMRVKEIPDEVVNMVPEVIPPRVAAAKPVIVPKPKKKDPDTLSGMQKRPSDVDP